MRSLLNLKFCFQSGFLTYTFSCNLAELKIYGECMGETLISDRIFGWNNYDFKISSVAPWKSFVHF